MPELKSCPKCKKQETEKELVVLERKNGWYGGYEQRNGEYEQVFNTDKSLLFWSIKNYTDKGYTVKCLDKTQEESFMHNRKIFYWQ